MLSSSDVCKQDKKNIMLEENTIASMMPIIIIAYCFFRFFRLLPARALIVSFFFFIVHSLSGKILNLGEQDANCCITPHPSASQPPSPQGEGCSAGIYNSLILSIILFFISFLILAQRLILHMPNRIIQKATVTQGLKSMPISKFLTLALTL